MRWIGYYFVIFKIFYKGEMSTMLSDLRDYVTTSFLRKCYNDRTDQSVFRSALSSRSQITSTALYRGD